MRRSAKQWASICVMAVICALAACKSRPALMQPIDPSTLGSVSGTIHFTGNAPAPVKLDTSMDPGCTLAGKDAYSEQYAVHDGKLANVYVYIKSMKLTSGTGFMSGSGSTGPAAVIDQKGCTYVPHVVAVQAGEFVEVDNDDPTMHNILTIPTVAGNQPNNTAQGPKGKPQFVHFNKPEQMVPVRCNVHPWMEAFINVSETEWFAVTGPDGRFSLKGMPPGEYTIGAVQEKLGEQDITVTVKPQTSATADFTFAIK